MHLSQQIAVLLLWLCLALIGGGHAKPWRWGPGSNSGPLGGPAWNGGAGDESTDNIIIHANGSGNRGNGGGGNWRY
ncbi:hypothetical protein KR054_012578 [Drosophila jambulina]|nr:hypothetical protein KR054_012578 [Drosophila jambulina]